MKKFISVSISVVVCLFLTIGCSDGDDPRDPNLVIYEECDLPLDEELVDNRPFIEGVKSIELGVSHEEVRYILGSPFRIGFRDKVMKNSKVETVLEWWYDFPEDFVLDYDLLGIKPLVPLEFVVIGFLSEHWKQGGMVIYKVYGTRGSLPDLPCCPYDFVLP